MWPFKKKIVEANYNRETSVLTVLYSDRSQKNFYGIATVWREMPLMSRCNLSTEILLSRIYTYVKVYGNPYPTSHLKKQTS